MRLPLLLPPPPLPLLWCCGRRSPRGPAASGAEALRLESSFGLNLNWFQSLLTLWLKSTLILLSSMSTLSIFKYACSHAALSRNSTNAYPRLAPVW